MLAGHANQLAAKSVVRRVLINKFAALEWSLCQGEGCGWFVSIVICKSVSRPGKEMKREEKTTSLRKSMERELGIEDWAIFRQRAKLASCVVYTVRLRLS